MRHAFSMLVLLPHTRSMLRPLAAARRRPPCLSLSGSSRVSAGTAPAAAASAAPPAPDGPSAARRFLIENKNNHVLRMECGNPAVLRQGLAETEGLPHVCIAGESNAGKSSLINHLLHKKGLARASSVAGKTRSVDLMVVNEQVVLADLPGLPSRDGQVTAIWEARWGPLVFDYIARCDELLAMLYVHDIRWPVSARVRTFLDEVRAHQLPVLLVLTKDDRILTELRDPQDREAEHALRQRLMRRVRRSLGFDGVHLHYSTNSELPVARKARRRLLRYVESMVDAGDRARCAAMLDGIAKEKWGPAEGVTWRGIELAEAARPNTSTLDLSLSPSSRVSSGQ